MTTSVKVHPKVEMIIAAFQAKELHASRSGREVVEAIGSVIAETSAATLEDLAAEFYINADALANSLKAYAPTMNVLHRLHVEYEAAREKNLPLQKYQAAVIEFVEAYRSWSKDARSRIAAIGKTIIPTDGIIYTFTLSETVMRTLLAAHESGLEFSVLVTESRPNNDGRVTAKMLAEAGIPVKVSIDACMSEMIQRVDLMMIGAEAILADGSAICKIGTYPSAMLACQLNIPVYVIVDSMKFDINSLMGREFALDKLNRNEVIPTELPASSNVLGSLFDRTPPEFISGLITDMGILHPSQVSLQMLEMPISEILIQKIH